MKTQKLELKHLAPYLPYNIKVHLDKWNEEVVGYKFEPNGEIRLQMLISRNKNQKRIIFWTPKIEHCKIILRPLSDLIKLGDDNIPINEHTINMLIGESGTYGRVTMEHYEDNIELLVESDNYQNYDSEKSIDFDLFEKVRCELLKGHYDIFGLIKKGLAIDINTIN